MTRSKILGHRKIMAGDLGCFQVGFQPPWFDRMDRYKPRPSRTGLVPILLVKLAESLMLLVF